MAVSLGTAVSAQAQQDGTQGEVVREARPSQSVEDVLREEHALFSDRLTIEPGISYSYSDRSQLALRGFLALDAIFLGLIVSVLITRSITAPVAMSVDLAQEIAKGDFTRRLDMHRHDEVGKLGKALDAMSDSLLKKAEIAETIADVAGEFGLDVAVEHFENPRDEDETHKMEIENDRYADLIDGQSTTFEEGVREILDTLVDHEETIRAHEDRFLPGVLTDE